MMGRVPHQRNRQLDYSNTSNILTIVTVAVVVANAGCGDARMLDREVVLPLEKLLEGKELDDWLPVRPCKDCPKATGRIRVKVSVGGLPSLAGGHRGEHGSVDVSLGLGGRGGKHGDVSISIPDAHVGGEHEHDEHRDVDVKVPASAAAAAEATELPKAGGGRSRKKKKGHKFR
jgi:hypothetical protein